MCVTMTRSQVSNSAFREPTQGEVPTPADNLFSKGSKYQHHDIGGKSPALRTNHTEVSPALGARIFLLVYADLRENCS